MSGKPGAMFVGAVNPNSSSSSIVKRESNAAFSIIPSWNLNLMRRNRASSSKLLPFNLATLPNLRLTGGPRLLEPYPRGSRVVKQNTLAPSANPLIQNRLRKKKNGVFTHPNLLSLNKKSRSPGNPPGLTHLTRAIQTKPRLNPLPVRTLHT